MDKEIKDRTTALVIEGAIVLGVGIAVTLLYKTFLVRQSNLYANFLEEQHLTYAEAIAVAFKPASVELLN